MSPRNAINGTTTTVVPPCSAHAGNMNNKLLPAPVGITATTGLSPALIALIAASCTPRNLASSPIMRFSCALASIFLSRCHRSTLASSASLSNGALFRLLLLLWSSTPAWKPKNLCQSVLDAGTAAAYPPLPLTAP
ncbi:hypothetical protein PTTW11_09879 [Pyrenophora teres f. teres]|uniref:Uncharacterized protein n=1 Tax=Pyrenophora teres f. teres TaxID=97479 RepID=A0A6S6WE94_9PLEO|nr:hypothetical protein PTTW11_09879 [Pyrenophora teres f. teres]